MTTLKELREKAGLTQEGVAEKIGVASNTIQNWEKSNNIPKPEQRSEVLKLYGFITPADQARVIGELGIIGYEGPEQISLSTVPTFLYPEGTKEYEMIINCWASAEELDMLAYAEYVGGSHRYGYRGKGEVPSVPMEFAFFEKYGGFNRTMHQLSEARNRLGKLYSDALDFAKNNPTAEYRLATMDKSVILDKIAILMDRSSNKGESDWVKELKSLNEELKTIKDEIIYSINGAIQPGVINRAIANSKQQFYGYDARSKRYGKYDGYVEIERIESSSEEYIQKKKKYETELKAYEQIAAEHPEMDPRRPQFTEEYSEVIRLTERGEQLIAWFE